MTKREKLIKIAKFLEEKIASLEKHGNTEINAPLKPLVYSSGTNIIFNKIKKRDVSAKEKFLKNRMHKSAKNVTAQFEEHGLSEYIKSLEPCLEKISTSYKVMNLLPNESDVLETIKVAINQFNDESFNFYNSFLIDTFNGGRMHLEQFGSKKSAAEGLKKYAFQTNDVNQFEKLINVLHVQSKNEMDKLTKKIIKAISNSYQLDQNKETLLENLQNVYSSFSFNVETMLRKHAWQSYLAGNLYQLKKDNVEYVSWKTSHQNDDCLHCRALETGDTYLVDKNGMTLPYHRNIDKVSYLLSDIIKISEFEGPAYFAHDDCRCYWMPEEKRLFF